jgi:hypothetical protein
MRLRDHRVETLADAAANDRPRRIGRAQHRTRQCVKPLRCPAPVGKRDAHAEKNLMDGHGIARRLRRRVEALGVSILVGVAEEPEGRLLSHGLTSNPIPTNRS